MNNFKINTTLGLDREVKDYFEPESIDELKENIVDYFSRYNEISVFSTGKNWGYGDHAPNVDQSLLISLKKCKKIIDFDDHHGLVTLEPGVTYGMLHDFLEKKGGNWIAPVHGGGPECSVIGNALERGYGITPCTDHFGAIQCLEAIYSDGSLYEGSLKKLGQEKLNKLFKYGVGPYQDGLFSQSGLGIVTQATIRLAPRPEYVEMFYYNIKKEDDLILIVEIIKDLRKKLGDVIGGINLLNRERVLSMMSDYPASKVISGEKLSNEELDGFAKGTPVSPWLVFGALYGEKEIVRSADKIIKRHFKNISKTAIYYNTSNKPFFNFLGKFLELINYKKGSDSLKMFSLGYEILLGKPNNVALKLSYWKHENRQLVKSEVLSPGDDGCGLIWYAPLVEMDGQNVRRYVDFVNEASAKFNYNPLITLTTIDSLCFDSTIPILFNKNSKKQVENAWNYYEFLLTEGAKLGFFPYRLNIESQKKITLGSYNNLPAPINRQRYK